MDSPTATSGAVEVADPVSSPSYPYLNAVEDRRRRKRAGLVWLAIAVGAVVVVGSVLLATSTGRSTSPESDHAEAATTAPTTRAPVTTAAPTTSRPPYSGGATASAVAAVPTTAAGGPAPEPAVTITVAPAEVVCNEGATETATVLSWTSTDAETAVVQGPSGQLSTLAAGSREVVPSRPCAEAPFEDVYSISVRNATGTSAGESAVTWLPNADEPD